MIALAFSFLLAANDAHPVAPEFPAGLEWLNTQKPLTLQALRGQVVLLDFWTYCCINCMHVIPELKALEAKFAKAPFVVIGVHSGKFDNEKDAANIRAAIARNGLTHPVIVDSNYKVWDAFGVQAWPTLVLIGPGGAIIGGTTGEGHEALLEHFIQAALDEAKKNGTLGAHMTVGTHGAAESLHALSFPGKVIAAGTHLFIADTDHDRIIETTLDGAVVASFGGFHRPEGMTLNGETLYVADTEAHQIRAIDLHTKNVQIVAGTGELGRTTGGDALKVALASPWDVLVLNDTLYIANAGSHQLLALDLKTQKVRVVAGSGREGHEDGTKLDDEALAQTSGLTTDGHVLFFVDSESSSVRRYDPATGTLTTIVGKGLFDFGDKDGTGDAVRLQHPLGIVWDSGALWVADSYNHKIKRIDPALRSATSIAGGKSGAEVGAFFEPGGISAEGGTLYVADTNNSRVIALDEKTHAAKAVNIRGL